MSLLLDHGHRHAQHYPLGRVMDEASIVTARVNARIVTEASLLQQAVSSILSKKSRASFTKQLESLTVESIPSGALKALSDPENY